MILAEIPTALKLLDFVLIFIVVLLAVIAAGRWGRRS